MFGTYRYLLAFLVAYAHLWLNRSGEPGMYAVFGFYMLSGYLMSYILNRNYGFSAKGLARYGVNRALRIYPPYLIVLLISLVLVLLYPQAAERIITRLQLPHSSTEWLKNIFIFGLTYDTPSRFVPPAWSLNIELIFYIGMAVLLSRRRGIVIIWFCLSLCYTAFAIYKGYTLEQRYYGLSTSLPFSIGALIYYHKDFLKKIPRWHVFPVAALFSLNAIAPTLLWGNIKMEGFYVSLLLSAYLLACLININGSDTPRWFSKADKFLGNLSYPIFLCHWPVAAFCLIWRDNLNISFGEVPVFLVVFPVINLVSYVIYYVVDRRVNKIRDNVRSGISKTADSQEEPADSQKSDRVLVTV